MKTSPATAAPKASSPDESADSAASSSTPAPTTSPRRRRRRQKTCRHGERCHRIDKGCKFLHPESTTTPSAPTMNEVTKVPLEVAGATKDPPKARPTHAEENRSTTSVSPTITTVSSSSSSSPSVASEAESVQMVDFTVVEAQMIRQAKAKKEEEEEEADAAKAADAENTREPSSTKGDEPQAQQQSNSAAGAVGGNIEAADVDHLTQLVETIVGKLRGTRPDVVVKVLDTARQQLVQLRGSGTAADDEEEEKSSSSILGSGEDGIAESAGATTSMPGAVEGEASKPTMKSHPWILPQSWPGWKTEATNLVGTATVEQWVDKGFLSAAAAADCVDDYDGGGGCGGGGTGSAAGGTATESTDKEAVNVPDVFKANKKKKKKKKTKKGNKQETSVTSSPTTKADHKAGPSTQATPGSKQLASEAVGTGTLDPAAAATAAMPTDKKAHAAPEDIDGNRNKQQDKAPIMTQSDEESPHDRELRALVEERKKFWTSVIEREATAVEKLEALCETEFLLSHNLPLARKALAKRVPRKFRDELRSECKKAYRALLPDDLPTKVTIKDPKLGDHHGRDGTIKFWDQGKGKFYVALSGLGKKVAHQYFAPESLEASTVNHIGRADATETTPAPPIFLVCVEDYCNGKDLMLKLNTRFVNDVLDADSIDAFLASYDALRDRYDAETQRTADLAVQMKKNEKNREAEEDFNRQREERRTWIREYFAGKAQI